MNKNRKVNYDSVLNYIKRNLSSGIPVSLTKVAEQFGITRTAVRKILKSYGYYDEYKQKILAIKHERDKKTEIEFLKEQVKYWKKLYERATKVSSFEERLISLFRREIQRLMPDKTNLNKKDIYFDSEEEPVLILSDLHIGETVEKEQVLDLNEYNFEIAKQRLSTVYAKFLKFVDRFEGSNRQYKSASLFFLGDFVSGIIWEELLQDMPIVEQVLETAYLLSDIVYDMSKRFKEVNVYGVIGNHGRIFKKPYYKNKYSNFDYLVYKIVEIRCSRLTNVNFHFPKSSMLIVNKFNRWNFLLRHGEGKSNSFAGIPVYGIVRDSAKIQQVFNAYKDIHIHYQILGHYHASMQIPQPGGQIIVCGSLVGVNEFSFNKFLSSTPSQTMLILSSQSGIFARVDLFPET